jgi:hypothetical protein
LGDAAGDALRLQFTFILPLNNIGTELTFLKTSALRSF